MFDLERYCERAAKRAEDPALWENKLRDEMKTLLYGEAFETLVGLVMQEIIGRQVQLSTMNLVSEDSRAEAIKVQGMLMGMRRFLDLIVEVGSAVSPQEKENDDGGI